MALRVLGACRRSENKRALMEGAPFVLHRAGHEARSVWLWYNEAEGEVHVAPAAVEARGGQMLPSPTRPQQPGGSEPWPQVFHASVGTVLVLVMVVVVVVVPPSGPRP